jgi:hypothetical protein
MPPYPTDERNAHNLYYNPPKHKCKYILPFFNYRRNNNEEMWQLRRNFVAIGTKSYAKQITYDTAAECAMKVHRNFQRKSMVISMSAISQNQIYDSHDVYATNIHGKLRRSFVAIAMVVVK